LIAAILEIETNFSDVKLKNRETKNVGELELRGMMLRIWIANWEPIVEHDDT
jgi:hypothetical protein